MITVLDLDAAEVIIQARTLGWELEFQQMFNRPLEMAMVMHEFEQMTPEEKAALRAGDPEICEMCEKRQANRHAGQKPMMAEMMAETPKGFSYV